MSRGPVCTCGHAAEWHGVRGRAFAECVRQVEADVAPDLCCPCLKFTMPQAKDRTFNALLFLDIDGVLNSSRWMVSDAHRALCALPRHLRRQNEAHACDPLAMVRLNRIVRATGAAVVISSSWKDFSGGGAAGTMECARLLRGWGLQARVLGATPSLSHLVDLGARGFSTALHRGDEIQAWLEANAVVTHRRWFRRTPSKYLILDDSPEAGIGHDGHFLQTHGSVGLSREDQMAAIEYLCNGMPLPPFVQRSFT